MATLNTQLGYAAPKKPRTPAYALPQAPSTSGGVSRALAGIKAPPAAPSYSSPYADPTQSLFQQPQLPTVQPQAPAGTPASYTPRSAAAPAAPPGHQFDLETDPILQQMHAMADKQRSDAEAGALAQRKQLAIQYGDQNYGNSIDPNTGQAAAQNPFSVTANLAHQYETGTHNLDEQLNQHNLFYSGARINELANALRDYQGQQAQAAGAFQGALGNVDQNRIAALLGADSSEQGAYNDAWSRALAAALAAGATPQAMSPSASYPPAGTSVAPSGSGSPFTGGAPGGTITGDPEHNAFVTGGSDVDPFAVGAPQPQPQSQPQDPTQMLLLHLLAQMQ